MSSPTVKQLLLTRIELAFTKIGMNADKENRKDEIRSDEIMSMNCESNLLEDFMEHQIETVL